MSQADRTQLDQPGALVREIEATLLKLNVLLRIAAARGYEQSADVVDLPQSWDVPFPRPKVVVTVREG